MEGGGGGGEGGGFLGFWVEEMEGGFGLMYR